MNEQKVAVLIDSGCDVPVDFRQKYDIWMLPLRVMYPEKDYEDGVDIDPMMVYRRFPDEYPSTSTPSLMEVQDIFDKIRDAGYEKIIAVTISSGLSGTFNTIRLAASQQEELEIFVFDTKNISVASGIWAIWAAAKLEEGWPFERVKEGLIGKIYDSKVMFYMDTLKYLKKAQILRRSSLLADHRAWRRRGRSVQNAGNGQRTGKEQRDPLCQTDRGDARDQYGPRPCGHCSFTGSVRR